MKNTPRALSLVVCALAVAATWLWGPTPRLAGLPFESVAQAQGTGLVGHWTFEPGSELQDLTGNFGDLVLSGGATVAGGALDLGSGAAALSGPYAGPTLTSKTLVAWLRMDTLDVQQGSPLSIEEVTPHGFDAIVYGELEPHRWMAGSDFYNRTQYPVPGFAETTTGQPVIVAISYEDVGGGQVRIRIYRNGDQVADYTSANLRAWGAGVRASFGPRGGGAGSIDAHVDEARVYDHALTAQEIAALPQAAHGLVGYWSFDDGTATDQSGFGNHGTVVGAAPTAGVSGQALDLSGPGNYVDIPNSATLQSAHLTVAYWAWFNAAHNPVIATKATYTANAWQASVTSVDSVTQNVQFCSAAGATGQCFYSPAITPSPTGRWMHVVQTYDGSEVKQYVDGQLVNTAAAVYRPDLVTTPIRLGAAFVGYDFDGLLDEVRIYDTALDATEVADLYGAGWANSCLAGTYLDGPGGACVPAPLGRFVPTDGATTATLCPVGKYSATLGAIACEDAPSGTFVATLGAASATACAPGTYAPTAGSASCTVASPGFFVAQEGMTEQTACADGATSTAGATYCTEPLALPAGATYTASSSWSSSPAMAFDGNPDTGWNAGAHPVQWIEVDFGSPQTLTGITGLVGQLPAGNTVHQVTLDGQASFTWSGYTTGGQTLTHTFATPQTAQRVRITTTSSPSWVAWPEIGFTVEAAPPVVVERLAEFDFENVTAENTQWVLGPLSAPASLLHPSFTSGAFGWTDADGYYMNFWEQGVRTWSTNVFLMRGLGPVGSPGLTQFFMDLDAAAPWSMTGFSMRVLNNDYPSIPFDVIAVQNGVSTTLGTIVSNCTTYPDCQRSLDLSATPHAFDAGPARILLAAQFNTGSAFIMVDDLRIDGIAATTGGGTGPLTCDAGSYLASPGDTACTPAPAGRFVPDAGATEALACPVGTYQPLIGQTACLDAPAGSAVDIMGAAEATLCAVGTYQPLAGQTSCLDAPAGRFVDLVGAEAATACAAGTYQPLTGQTSCLLAPAGTYVGSAGAAEATACDAGFFSATAGATACTAAATSCAAGEWIASAATSTADISCAVAGPGQFATGVETAPVACAEGTYQPLSGQSACELAPAGRYVDVTGAEAATLCAAGSFQPNEGQASCILAPAGSFVANAGATEATVCPTGTVSTEGATACTNTAPTLAPVPVSVVANQSFAGTLAMVGDAETDASALTVQLVSAPAGVTVTNLTNTGGTISGVVGATCAAVSGPVVLSVADAALLATSGALQVTVAPATPPAIGTYADVTLNPGEGATATPTVAATGATAAPVVAVGAGFTGTVTVDAAGVVTIASAGPAGSYPVTVTLSGPCGTSASRGFTLVVRTAAQQVDVLRTTTIPALLASGGLDARSAARLTSLLGSLSRLLASGDLVRANRLLQTSFSNVVSAGLKSGKISPEAAQVLLRAAQQVGGELPSNNTPVAIAGSVATSPEDTVARFAIYGQDADQGDILQFAVVTPPAHGRISLDRPTRRVGSTGPYWMVTGTYRPDRDYSGPDAFTFAVFDGLARSGPVSKVFNVTPVNDNPVASSQTLTVESGASLAITLSATDVDGDTLTYRSGRPRYGRLTGQAPDLVYTAPRATQALVDSFTFLVDDGHGGRARATVTINVTPVNVAPVCRTSFATISAKNPKPGWQKLTVSDANGDALTFAWTSVPSYGRVSGIQFYKGSYIYYYVPTVSPFTKADV
ncbi:MAG: LamG-like jellyroll fold domain-containing protein, partial [Vicinamibacterales bacterium]